MDIINNLNLKTKKMKKKLNFLSVIFLISLISFLNSCKKDELENDSDNSLAFSEDQTENRIKDFIKNAIFTKEHSGTKSTQEDMETNDAIWNIEAALNYAYTNSQVSHSEYEIREIFLTLPKTDNGNISFDDVSAAFFKGLNSLNNELSEVSATLKDISIVDIEESENNSDAIILKQTFLIGKGNRPFHIPFTHDWHYGEDLGRCDGSMAPIDAAAMLQGKLTSQIPMKLNYSYNINVSLVILEPVQFDNSTYSGGFNNLRDYLIFQRNTGLPNFSTCITAADLNFYFDNMKDMMFNYNPDPGNKKLSECVVVDFRATDPDNNNFEIIKHTFFILYGEAVYSPNRLPYNNIGLLSQGKK